MASNPTPDNNDILLALSDRLADGCHTYEVAIGIKQNIETVIRAASAAAVAAELQLGMKKSATTDAYAALDAADVAGQETITNCKLRLQQKLGQRWNPGWEPTGFPDQSVATPNTQDERFTLLAALKAYFTSVPANESEDMGATAAACDAAWAALSAARFAVGQAETAQTNAMNTRIANIATLRKRVRGLIGELETLIEEDDARWESFGLNTPANPTAPEPVASVTVTPTTNHRLEVSWPYATRAVRFRIEAKIVGVDDEFKNKGSFKDLETILKGFSANQTVEVRVIAGNDGGDATPSPVATATVA